MYKEKTYSSVRRQKRSLYLRPIDAIDGLPPSTLERELREIILDLWENRDNLNNDDKETIRNLAAK